MLYGPEKGVPTDITTVGQFDPPSLGFTAELLAANCHALGDPWRSLAIRNRASNPFLQFPSLTNDVANQANSWCSLADCQDHQGEFLRFPLYRSPTVASTMTPKHLACICFGGLAVFLANLLCNTFCLDDTLLHLACKHVVSLGWTVP